MNDNETTVLTARLNMLAEDMTPPLDVVGQVRAARLRHQKQRRGRIALVAVATATAAVVVGAVTTADLLSATPRGGEVAVPSRTAPATTEPAPSATPTSPSSDAPGLPVGWEPRSFQGVTFAVPPGSRAEDTVDPRPVTSWMEGPSLTWNGPALGGGEYSQVKVMVVETFEGGLTPADGGEWFTVPGAESAYGGIAYWPGTGANGPTVEAHTFWLQVLVGDRQVKVSGTFSGDDAGREMARDVIASVDVTAMPDGSPGTPPDDDFLPSTTWETRTLQDITFSVPPGSSAPEHRTDSSIIWYGPEVEGRPTNIGLDVHTLRADQRVGDDYTPITVPGAERAWVKTDLGTINGGLATFNVWIHDGGRNINIGGTLPLGPWTEDTMQRVIDSVVVG